MFLRQEQKQQKRCEFLNQESSIQSIDRSPIVSVITVVFNGEEDLEETILSVINQSYQRIEYIIIDGNSTDRTLDIIYKYNSQIDCWISEPDEGIYDAMNKGIMAATGEIIGLINCGDTYTHNAIEEIIKIYQSIADNQYLVITGAMYRFDRKKDIQFKIVKNLEDLRKGINKGMPINHPATFVSKSIYTQFGYFNSQYRICGDYDFIFRIYHNPLIRFEFTKLELAYMRLGGISEKFISLWVRCQEHFLIRKHNLSIHKNIFICLSWCIITTTKFLLKKIVSNSLISIYYELKHGQ
ncbi:MAG: glycosyltransferase family 2 protein [Xenococcaceae cyanobacterium MO_188.B32]|nr:glycosyltransferase family 2 protein [Xenococcaceae cyanobacterium MO_188.B32]